MFDGKGGMAAPDVIRVHELPEMSRAQKIVNLHVVFVPIVAVVVATTLLWKVAVGPTELILVGVLYVITGLGIHVGFHRLFSHRCFKTHRPIRWAFAVAGSMAIQGTLFAWTADHRKHHQFSDREGDPHSPHVGRGEGALAAVDAFFHAHFGWIFTTWGVANRDRYIPDLVAERGLRTINNLYGIWILASLGLPFGIGWLVSGGIGGALTALLWGGPVRIFLLQHVTFAVNSVGHYWGNRRFLSRDESRNVWWLAAFSFGDAWHNNHHAFPSSAFHGLSKREVDLGGLLIAGLERVGLAWDVVRISPEAQARKALAEPPTIAPGPGGFLVVVDERERLN